jgi:hypothetical protein
MQCHEDPMASTGLEGWRVRSQGASTMMSPPRTGELGGPLVEQGPRVTFECDGRQVVWMPSR